MIKLIDILNEEQKFDFDKNKNGIISYIKTVKNNQTPWPLFYSLLTGERKVGDAKKIGFDDAANDKWKKIFKSSMFNSNGVWSQIDFNPQLSRKTGKDRTLNYYITLAKDKDNISKFIKSIPDLNQRLKKLSDEKQSPISWKTHTILDVFVGHNDSLKIYYYDVDLKNDIEKVAKEWLQQNGLKSSNRTHTHGVDAKIGDGDKQSWGQILADIIDKQFTELIKKYKDKYTDEQYFEWIKKNMPEIIKKVNIKYK
jgi:hypothetical protein